jgi:hypothetical protein
VISTVCAYIVFMALTARASLPLLPLRLDGGTIFRAGLACVSAVILGGLWQIENHVVSFLLRGVTAVIVYAGILAMVDGEARGYLGKAWQYIKRRGTGQGVLASA